ncbi:hypothetical protein [Roseomonas sp. AR75]|uniref:hypothetical protein n=1 Tax=Roseomonas sp. AR75 TaxID=2562311 RepID=UPI0010C024AF|nr:hypothetical protein [Roseomonas sp. AR75]
MARAAIAAVLGVLAGPAVAQEPPVCKASGWTPLRSAAEVQAAVREHACPPGSRLDAGMTVAGQAVVLQMSGLCTPDSVRTRTVRPTPDARVLGFTCILAAR